MTSDEARRHALVRDLLEFARPMGEIAAQLATMVWDYDGEGVELARRHLSTVIRRYLEAELLSKEVEFWANLVEAREDVCFEVGYEQQIEQVLHELANPTLTQPLDQERANVLLRSLPQG